MASTDELHVQNLFSMEGYVCLVTGGGKCILELRLYTATRQSQVTDVTSTGTGIGLMATQALAANGPLAMSLIVVTHILID